MHQNLESAEDKCEYLPPFWMVCKFANKTTITTSDPPQGISYSETSRFRRLQTGLCVPSQHNESQTRTVLHITYEEFDPGHWVML
jgi:hypothetical protein